MKKANETETPEEFEKSLQVSNGTEKYVLRLYVTGMTPRSIKAIENIRKDL